MAMHPTRFMFYLGVMVFIIIILMALNPLVIWSVDPILVLGPMVITMVVITYYFYSEGHRWAYSLVSHQSHSSSAEGKPSFIIPAMKGYPEMVGFAKGGSRLFNVYGFGGKKDGFLIVPKCQVINISGHRMANTVTRDIEYTALPPHIREFLERDRRFSEKGMVEFGLVPYIKNVNGDYYSNLESPALENLLDNSHQENHDLRENIKALQSDIRSLTGIIRDISDGLRSVPSETLQDRVTRATGGDRDE